jgi:hypothetical protein
MLGEKVSEMLSMHRQQTDDQPDRKVSNAAVPT